MKAYTPTPTVSAVTDFTSAPIDLGDIRDFSIQAVFSGSNVVGTFLFQASNDGATYINIPGGSFAVASSDDVIMDFSAVGFRYIRYDWDYDSGTGNITVYFVGKNALPSTNSR
jgi:hypothetical protein